VADLGVDDAGRFEAAAHRGGRIGAHRRDGRCEQRRRIRAPRRSAKRRRVGRSSGSWQGNRERAARCDHRRAIRRKAPRFLAGASDAHPDALAWAAKRGFREIGRRIEAFVELATFDPGAFAARVDEVRRSGIVFQTIEEILDGRDDAGRERFIQGLHEAERPMWEDIPWATPTPHWPLERFRQLGFESGQMIADASVVAYDGETIAALTTTGKRERLDGYTWMTGVGRVYSGRGLAPVIKVEAL
jgi:hypothetical protein